MARGPQYRGRFTMAAAMGLLVLAVGATAAFVAAQAPDAVAGGAFLEQIRNLLFPAGGMGVQMAATAPALPHLPNLLQALRFG